jgi:hypothetical protein
MSLEGFTKWLYETDLSQVIQTREWIIPTLQAVADLPLSTAIREGAFLFPVIECIHVLALATVVGTIAIVDLRLIGVAAHRRRISALLGDMLPLTFGGFVIAAMAGTLLFMSNAALYFGNANFRLKMMFMALAGVNMIAFHCLTQRAQAEWDDAPVPALAARAAGALSLLFWLCVVYFARNAGFTLR